jgi:hypothetical protein
MDITDTKEYGGVSGTLELTDETRQRIREMQDLSRRVEDGEEGARKELRRAVHESSPEVIARCSDIARTYRGFLVKTASGKDPLVEEAFVKRAELLAAEIAGEGASPLERLLSERIASLWALTELQEALLSAYYGGTSSNVSPTSSRWQSCRRALTADTSRL